MLLLLREDSEISGSGTTVEYRGLCRGNDLTNIESIVWEYIRLHRVNI